MLGWKHLPMFCDAWLVIVSWQKQTDKEEAIVQGYFFTDFLAPTETGISKTLSLAQNPSVLYMC